MYFTKMHGLGNDYIYVNGITEHIREPERLAVRLSDRHFGVGADGLILILPSIRADFRMDIYNADGSRAEMCGNGIRCLAKYVYDRGLTKKKELIIETSSGTEFPEDLTSYALVIHCGGCMLNEREVKYRMKCAEDQRVPFTNYGIAIAQMKGILKRSIELFPNLNVE